MPGRSVALIIATYEYRDAGLSPLMAPAADAEDLADALSDPAIAGFEVTTIINQPHHVVGEAIGEFFSQRRRDDLALLYFTGHGMKDDDGRLYLAMTNTRRDALLFTGLSAEQLNDAMERSLSRRKVLILDCCYSGAFPAGRPAKSDQEVHTLERFKGKGRVVLTASDSTQYAFEGDAVSGSGARSVFTRFLVEGIRSGNADLDNDGEVALDELYSYVHERVTDEMPQQRPKKQEDVEGRIYIAHNINWTLPPHIKSALASPIPAQRFTALEGLEHLARIGSESVRRVAVDEMQKLSDDDSRTVSTAATAALERTTTPSGARDDGAADEPAGGPGGPVRAAAPTPPTDPTARPRRVAGAWVSPPATDPTDPPRQTPPVTTAELPGTGGGPTRPTWWPFTAGVLTRPEFGAVVGAAVIFLFLFSVAPPFRTLPAFVTVLYASSTIGIVTVGIALLMIGGEFDLSSGVSVVTSALCAATVCGQLSLNLWAGVLFSLALALAIGFFNGYLVVRTRIPGFLITLAVAFMLRGMNLGVTKATTGTVASDNVSGLDGFPSARAVFASDIPLGSVTVKITVLWWLLFVALSTWILLRTRLGDWIFASGGDAAAAEADGVPVDRVKIGLFMGVAFLSWFYGMHLLFNFSSVQSGLGVGNEFIYIIAAATGGYGSAIGPAIGAFIFGMSTQGIVFAGFDPNWFYTFLGAMLLIALLINLAAKNYAPPSR